MRVLHSLVNPKFFIPVHGEYRHLKKHAKLAESIGMSDSRIMIAEIGDTVELTSNTAKFGEKIHAGSRFVDGVKIDDADSGVLKDRRHLSVDGIVIINIVLSERSGQLLSVKTVGKGLVFSEEMEKQVKTQITNLFYNIDAKAVDDKEELALFVRKSVKNYLFKATKKNPMILPVIMEI